jgi:hypothetical protein
MTKSATLTGIKVYWSSRKQECLRGCLEDFAEFDDQENGAIRSIAVDL